MSDEELVRRLVDGDDEALGHLYDRHGDIVFGLARRVTRSDALAQDVAQEVFTFVWEHPERVDLARGSLRAYLGVLAHRRAVDLVRREERLHRREERSVAATVVEPAPDHEVVELLHSSWSRTRVGDALAALPWEQREALVLAYFDGLSYRQVAVRLGIPEGTAKSRLRLALARLRTVLDEREVKAWT
jgi:RNA polymerase sigma factor (sigma-70 family)